MQVSCPDSDHDSREIDHKPGQPHTHGGTMSTFSSRTWSQYQSDNQASDTAVVLCSGSSVASVARIFYGNNSGLGVSLLLYGEIAPWNGVMRIYSTYSSEFALGTCFMFFAAIVLFRQLVVSHNLNYRIIGEP